MAMDFTFDMFVETLGTCKALPLAHGVYRNFGDDCASEFCTWLLTEAKEFKTHWSALYGDKRYADRLYIGNAFMNYIDWSFFSDYYKDAFNQRPHLDRDLYVSALGFETNHDTIRAWSNMGVDYYSNRAKDIRAEMLKRYEERGF